MSAFAKNSRGVTLVELLVAIGIFTIISMGAGWILIQSIRHNGIIFEQLSSQSEGRKAVQHVIDVVRKAELSSVGSYPIASASSTELILYANVDADSLRERVRFWLDGTTLKQGVLKPSGNPISYTGTEYVVELAHYITNSAQSIPTFVYYDELYTGSQNPLASPVTVTDIRLVKVQLNLEKDANKSPVPLHVESVVEIRNLKSN
jgi:prepilin-type N-terminal cleavage/methylation domain-containing protein